MSNSSKDSGVNHSYPQWRIEMERRYQEVTLPLFGQTFELSEKAILIRAKKDSSGVGYVLMSV